MKVEDLTLKHLWTVLATVLIITFVVFAFVGLVALCKWIDGDSQVLQSFIIELKTITLAGIGGLAGGYAGHAVGVKAKPEPVPESA